MDICPICNQQYRGLAYSVSVKDLQDSKIADKKNIENLRQKGLIEEDEYIGICKSCQNEMESSLIESNYKLNGFPRKITNFFSNEDRNKLIHAHAKVFNIQPPVIILFSIGIFLLILIRIDVITSYVNLIGIITILFPMIYSLMWLLWRYSSWDIFIGKKGVIREVKATSAFGYAAGYFWVHAFPYLEWNQIKSYSIKSYGYRLHINKYNLLNMNFFIDIFVRKNSQRWKTVNQYLMENNIPLKNKL